MKILNSANVASLVNIMLDNARGTTTTTEGAIADGLIVAEDLSHLVDAGIALNSLINASNFKNIVTGMLDGIGKILYENVKLESPSRFDLFIDENEYKTVIEKVRISGIEFEQSYLHSASGGSSFADMFNNHPLTFSVKVWNTCGDYRTKPYTISETQLRSAALNPDELLRLIGEIYSVVEVTYYKALREAEKRIVFNQAGNCCLYRSGVTCIDVLKAYKDETGVTLTTQTYKTSDDFKRWFYGFFDELKRFMAEDSKDYNCEDNEINTLDDDRRAFLMTRFMTSLKTISKYQSAENFKDALDNVYSVPYLQNRKERDKLSILPVDPPVITTGKHVTNVTITGIIGMIWDRRGTFLTASKIETGAVRNDFDKWTNYTHIFTVREMCDKGSNAILLVACDATGTNKAYTITEESDT